MKHLVLLFIAVLILLASCSEKKSSTDKSEHITTEIKKMIVGEVILADNGSCNYYDVAVTQDYYAFLDYYSDTLLQVLDKQELTLRQMLMQESDTLRISHPSFTKYDYANRGKKNTITIWDNGMSRLKRIDLENKQAVPYVTADTFPLPIDILPIGSTNSCILKNQTYTVPYKSGKPCVFYSGNLTNGIYQVPPFPNLMKFLPDNILEQAYTSDLVINEEKEVVVAALRFISSVNFYNLNSDLQHAACFGEHYTIPMADITGRFLDAGQSVKSFIDICASDKYVFCLYDGTTGYTSPSTLVVFDWEGRHKGNFRVDHSLRKIAMDPSGEYLIGLAANKQERRDVVRYNIKSIL